MLCPGEDSVLQVKTSSMDGTQITGIFAIAGICLGIAVLVIYAIIISVKKAVKDLDIEKFSTKSYDFFSFEDLYKETKTPMLIVSIYGKKYRLLLDTGAHNSCLDMPFLRTIALHNPKAIISRDANYTAADGQVMQAFNIEMEFSIRNIDFKEKFMAMDLAGVREFSRRENLKVVGVLGNDFFEKYQWKLDFDKLIVWHKRKKNEV